MFKTVVAIFLAIALCVSTVGCAASGPSTLHKPRTSLKQNPGNPSQKVVIVDDSKNFGAGGSVEASDVLIMTGLVLVGSALLIVLFLANSGGTSGGKKGGM
jgi:hypothetical protein